MSPESLSLVQRTLSVNATLLRVGLESAELKPLGPVHEYREPLVVLLLRYKVVPGHTGLLLLLTGLAGVGLKATITVSFTAQPALFTCTIYIPVSTLVIFVRTGF